MNVKSIYKRCMTAGTVIIAMAGFLAVPSVQAQQGANALESIEVAALPGNQVQLRFRLSGTAPDPSSFTINNPARIAIDIPDTHIAMSDRRTEIGIGAIRNVITAESQGKTRVVINLSNLIEYQTSREGNSIFVLLGDSGAAAVSAPSASMPAPIAGNDMPTAKPAAPKGKAVEAIDFRRGENGEGRIVVTLSDPKTIVDLKQEGSNVVVEFQGANLPDRLVQRYDVIDFATPVKTVDATKRGGDTRLEVAATGKFEQLAYQADNTFTLELKPIIEDEEDEASREKEYVGERITLNFQDIEVRAVLQIIADISGMNVVVSDAVTGNLTLRLDSVPWDQALDIVLRTKGLGMRQNGNVVLVAPATEIAEIERIELEARQQVRELEPLRSEFIQINYAKASDLAGLIKSSENSLLSERGSVTIDERTNTLLVQDVDENLSDIRRLVRTLDIAVKQVLIESRIVIANDDFNRELGARVGYTNFNLDPNNPNRNLMTSGDTSQNLQLIEDISNGDPLTFIDPDRFNVDVPVANPAGSIAFAVLGSSYLVDLELSALQAEGQGEVVSAPRVVTANQKEALIRQGVEIPYQEASASGATTTQFKLAVLELKVTPQITPDDRIVLDLVVKKDNIGEQVPSATGGFVPSIDKREVNTQVLVNNGDTVVLGGIYETTRGTVISKVPLLGDIPGIGFLFRNKSEQNDKRELLIFVTPKILKDGLTAVE